VRTVSLDELKARLSVVPGTPRVVVSGNAAVPATVMAAVDQAMESYVFHGLNVGMRVPEREGVVAETCFVGAGMRKHPRLRYVPSRLSQVPVLYRGTLPPEIVIAQVAPPRDGMVSLGIEVNVIPAAIEACRTRGGLVIAVINPAMPYTFVDAEIPVGEFDLAVEVDEDLGHGHHVRLDEASAAIGEQVASMVLDGSTMQLGIGAVPDATLNALVHHRGLRVWTEMFSDGILKLDSSGALDPDHPLCASFVMGSGQLYSWLDRNTRVRMIRTERSNSPARIAQQRQMTSVNTALQVDLFGQANASRINARIHSGFGGQTDFIVGALHSPRGQAFMALRSWHPKADVSTVVPLIDEPVTSFQQSAIVTENGVARLWGHDEKSQARQIIEKAAHPLVRDELWEEAYQLGLA
jgi:acyl-CoA hydrolase